MTNGNRIHLVDWESVNVRYYGDASPNQVCSPNFALVTAAIRSLITDKL